MTPLGLPASMFWVFVATIVAGSLGAIHFLIVHVALGRPVVETLPPALARDAGDGTSGRGPKGDGGSSGDGSSGEGGSSGAARREPTEGGAPE